MRNSSTTFTFFKLLALMAASIFILLIQQWQIILGVFVFIIVATFIANWLKPNKKFCHILRSLLIIGIMIIVFNMLLHTTPNYWGRFLNGITAAEKIVILSLLVFAFTASTSINNIISVFAFLPQKIQLLLTITFGIIPAIISETHKIILVQSARGINFRGLNFVKNIFPLIIPLLHRSFQRAEHLAILLSTRGYEI